MDSPQACEVTANSAELIRDGDCQDGGCIVFVGPCLAGLSPRQQQRLLHGMKVRPPVARGDVLGALCERPHTLVILDGYYYTRPSIPHKELLYAIESGVHVLGGASMGALRATELEAFGMEGVGGIFEAYRDRQIDGDDEVAILHTSHDDDYRALTIASIEVRYVLQRLQARGQITPSRGEAMIRDVRGISFERRTPEYVQELADRHLPAAVAERILAMLRRSSCKRRDAILTLARARQLSLPLQESEARQSTPYPSRQATTLYFDYFRLWGLSVPLDRSLSETTLHRTAYLALAHHPSSPDLVKQWRIEFLLAWLATQLDLMPQPEDLEAMVATLHTDYPVACRVLPALEIEQAARQRLLASCALEHFGDVSTALTDLGTRGLPDPSLDGPPSQDFHRILPPWAMVRSFAFTSLLPAALTLAELVFPLARRFAQWSEGAKVGRQRLEKATAQRWCCEPSDLEKEGLRRGLPLGDGFAEGLWEILEAMVIAERLRPPVAGYPEAKAALLACTPSAVDPLVESQDGLRNQLQT